MMFDIDNRVAWVDYAKGFCIVMVVAMHSTLGVEKAAGAEGWMHYLVAFAKPFRMPDFFMIAGLFLARVIDRDWRTYADKKVVHFVWFYVLWLTIQFAFKAPQIAGELGAAGTLRFFALSFIEPFGTIWFIYLLPIFFVVTKATRDVPWWIVWLAGAALETARIDTGWILVDEFASRFVYFYSGYVLAPHIFRLARTVIARPAAAASGLLVWALANGAAVFAGVAEVPGISLGLGLARRGGGRCLLRAPLEERPDDAAPLFRTPFPGHLSRLLPADGSEPVGPPQAGYRARYRRDLASGHGRGRHRAAGPVLDRARHLGAVPLRAPGLGASPPATAPGRCGVDAACRRRDERRHSRRHGRRRSARHRLVPRRPSACRQSGIDRRLRNRPAPHPCLCSRRRRASTLRPPRRGQPLVAAPFADGARKGPRGTRTTPRPQARRPRRHRPGPRGGRGRYGSVLEPPVRRGGADRRGGGGIPAGARRRNAQFQGEPPLRAGRDRDQDRPALPCLYAFLARGDGPGRPPSSSARAPLAPAATKRRRRQARRLVAAANPSRLGWRFTRRLGTGRARRRGEARSVPWGDRPLRYGPRSPGRAGDLVSVAAPPVRRDQPFPDRGSARGDNALPLDRQVPQRARLAGIRLACARHRSPISTGGTYGPSSTLFRGRSRHPTSFVPGRRDEPGIPSSTPACGNCGGRGGCTTGCAWWSHRS